MDADNNTLGLGSGFWPQVIPTKVGDASGIRNRLLHIQVRLYLGLCFERRVLTFPQKTANLRSFNHAYFTTIANSRCKSFATP